MKKNQVIVGMVVLAVIVGLIVWGHDRIHFDFHEFRVQVAMVDWTRIAIGLVCIYIAYVFRSLRWAYLLRHNKKVHPLSLLGTQVIGFTAVALIGRVAEALGVQAPVVTIFQFPTLWEMAQLFSRLVCVAPKVPATQTWGETLLDEGVL